MYKVCLRNVVRDPDRGRTWEATASSREEKTENMGQGQGGGDAKGR